ncbi:S1 RNA-binding domain-containing protein [uncultured Enterococcus sp.]|uniref:CvfB family protein n=1 Tax=uncultured Enterococcus sp. TaxID=167972 RepID=UPI00200A2CD5|nr:S1-like domain-containing RNA-binding protein [Enterococcus cecorum]
MNHLLATVISGLVIDENEKYYFVQKEGHTFRVYKEELVTSIGQMVEGFTYLNQKQQLAMTTKIPKVRQGHYAFSKVTEVRKDLGVFLDIGLPDKEMVLSLDELPTLTNLWPKVGDELLIGLRVDDKARIWATLADEKIFKAMSRKANESMHNQNVQARVYRLKMAGTYVLTQDFYLGFIHPTERYAEPRLGELVDARVIGLREDGVLYLSMKPRSYEAISEDAQMILAYLNQSASKSMPYTDKSSPEEIKQLFGISKGQFKRALGHLMKQNLIEQVDGKTNLL